jgi:hypothetical protein
VRGSRAASRPALAACALAACALPAALLAAGCGEARRDAHEPHGDFLVEIVKAKFPARQSIAHDTTLELRVRNAGSRTVPDVAVTLDSLSYASSYPKLAASQRPTWIVNGGPGPTANPPVETAALNPPGGGQTAFVHTWTLGALKPGATQTFAWKLTPVRAGRHAVHYAIAAGLDGRASTRLADGRRAIGSFEVNVASTPRASHVNGETGALAGGPSPTSQGPVGAVP